MGLKHYAIKSDGIKIANPRHLINASHNLRRKQKSLSRKKKGSTNRRKARIQLASVHERVANAEPISSICYLAQLLTKTKR